MRYILILAFTVCALHAADPAPAPDAAAMQAAMEQMSKTGAEHVGLFKAVGNWDVQSSMWMAPNTPAMTSTATATFTQILDGKWMRQDYRGVMMNQPYTGLGLSGYDTVAKKYVATWCDNGSTGFMTMTGESKDGGKTITYTSELPMCPMTGGPISMRHVLVVESADKMTYTMYNTPKGGVESKGMELVYTRKK